MLGMMAVTWFLSMWISNTATTAMMLPIVQAVLQQISSADSVQPDTDTPRSEQRQFRLRAHARTHARTCLLYTSDAADMAVV